MRRRFMLGIDSFRDTAFRFNAVPRLLHHHQLFQSLVALPQLIGQQGRKSVAAAAVTASAVLLPGCEWISIPA